MDKRSRACSHTQDKRETGAFERITDSLRLLNEDERAIGRVLHRVAIVHLGPNWRDIVIRWTQDPEQQNEKA